MRTEMELDFMFPATWAAIYFKLKSILRNKCLFYSSFLRKKKHSFSKVVTFI